MSRPDARLPIALSPGLHGLLMELLHRGMIGSLERDVHPAGRRRCRGVFLGRNPESGLSLGRAESDGLPGEVELGSDAERGQGGGIEGDDVLVLGRGDCEAGVVKHDDGGGWMGWRGVCGLGF